MNKKWSIVIAFSFFICFGILYEEKSHTIQCMFSDNENEILNCMEYNQEVYFKNRMKEVNFLRSKMKYINNGVLLLKYIYVVDYIEKAYPYLKLDYDKNFIERKLRRCMSNNQYCVIGYDYYYQLEEDNKINLYNSFFDNNGYCKYKNEMIVDSYIKILNKENKYINKCN